MKLLFYEWYNLKKKTIRLIHDWLIDLKTNKYQFITFIKYIFLTMKYLNIRWHTY